MRAGAATLKSVISTSIFQDAMSFCSVDQPDWCSNRDKEVCNYQAPTTPGRFPRECYSFP